MATTPDKPAAAIRQFPLACAGSTARLRARAALVRDTRTVLADRDPQNGLCEFLADDRGAASIEFTALVPFFLALMIFFVDASTLYLTHSEMYSAARDTSRKMAVESIVTPDAAKAFADNRLHLGDRTYQVDVRFGGDMIVTITVPVRDAVIFGALMTPIIGREISATVSTRREPFG